MTRRVLRLAVWLSAGLFMVTSSAFAVLMTGGPIGQGYLPVASWTPIRGPLAPTPEWLARAAPVAALAAELGWRGDELIIFVAIVGAESGYNPQALGDNFPIRGLLCPSHGLAQIRSCPDTPNGLDRGSREALIDPRQNLIAARRLWLSPLGRIHWSVWTNLRYREYLSIAVAATEGLR